MFTFGDNDLCIDNDCNINISSRSNLGKSYELPNGFANESKEAKI